MATDGTEEPRIVVIAADREGQSGQPCHQVSDETIKANPAESGLLVMVVGRPGVVGSDERRRSEDWLKAGSASAATGDVLMQSDEIRLRGNRAVVIAGVNRVDDYLAGLAAFADHNARIDRLESDVAERWRSLADDIPLTGLPRLGDLGRKTEISRIMRVLTRMRIELVSVDQLIYFPAASLSPVAHRLLNELALTSRHADRVRALDERLEVLEDTYGGIGGRLADLALHRREIAVELVIVLLLAVEAVSLIFPLVR